eukprot:604540-Rhodomonas_salina.1
MVTRMARGTGLLVIMSISVMLTNSVSGLGCSVRMNCLESLCIPSTKQGGTSVCTSGPISAAHLKTIRVSSSTLWDI